jgi:uncharacterized protein (TIGR02145 family)
MNKIFTVLTAVLISATLWAQAPQSFSYQAVVRGANNALVVNKPVGMKISLLQGSEKGKAVYVETHKPTSNENGLVSIAIGGGTKDPSSIAFTSIDWANGPYFVQTETDVTGGTSYSLSSVSQLLSVPYALYAGNSKDEQKLTVSATGDTLYLKNGGFVIIPGLSNANPITKPTNGYGPNITDVEGNSYKTVYIGTQQWMAENLKVTKYNDGTALNIIGTTLLQDNTTGAWSYCNNDVANNAKYGKLYNWYAVSPTTNGNKNVCPTGWHVPTNAEWTVLTEYLGGESVAGGKMKEVGTTNWNSPNVDATNTSLFTGLPGGNRESGDYYGIGSGGCWWSSTEISTTRSSSAWSRTLDYSNGNASSYNFNKNNGLSVRCIKDVK